ncbi:hypothetical protein Q3G72_023612 [Acer saccharum]|nr:hypothetical protein Q3G72_023612 [Acer saccharum]
MKKIFSVFSLKHLFLVFIALNVSLISRIINMSVKEVLNTRSLEKVHVSKNIQSSLPSPSSFFASSRIEAQDDKEKVTNHDHGDPTMYEKYWQQMGEKTTIVIPRLHRVVGIAIMENRHIVVGTGSSQLFQAAMYALSAQDASEPISVVSTAPYYSMSLSFHYPTVSTLKSELFKWVVDAHSFKKDGMYIENITSPNNPDGFIRQSMVNRCEGKLIHDLAYYWPLKTHWSSWDANRPPSIGHEVEATEIGSAKERSIQFAGILSAIL